MSEFWHDCFHYDRGCEDFNGCNNYECIETEVTFFEWLECHEFDDSAIYHCGDLTGQYNECYRYDGKWGGCEGLIVSTED